MSRATITVPTRALVRRLTADMEQRDHLLELLGQVLDGYRFTNRLDEAVLLVPAQVIDDIRTALGEAS